MSTLLDSLTSLASPAVGPIAARLGESETTVTRGVQTSLATVLGGLVTKAKDPSLMRQIFDLISSRPASASPAEDAQSMVSGLGAGAGASTSGVAGTLLGMLFGGRASAVSDLIARTAGFKNPASGSSILGAAASLVLGFLGKKVRDDGLNADSLSNLLAGERDSVLAAAPEGLTNLLDTGGSLPHVDAGETLRGAAAAGQRVVGAEPTQRVNRWLWPAVGLAAVALLVWFAASRRGSDTLREGARAGATVLDTAAKRAGAAVSAAGGEVSGAASGIGAIVKRTLPGGVVLSIPEHGTESKLIVFINDGSRPVDDTTWFDFDRVNFASGSAKILPESREQLNNIVLLLKAYPNVNVKVGGYTDSVGDPAANRRLSQERADVVRQALISNGISANRVQAEGYGEEHAVADNATEEGRARNRRMALRVTKK